MKQKTISSLKKKLWTIFSEWVRRNEANYQGYCKCVTCGILRPWKEMQAGHFIAGRTNSILFDERGVHPQCARCNIFLYGNTIYYYEYMERNYGKKVIDELKKKKNTIKSFTRQELEQMIKEYREKINHLLKVISL